MLMYTAKDDQSLAPPSNEASFCGFITRARPILPLTFEGYARVSYDLLTILTPQIGEHHSGRDGKST